MVGSCSIILSLSARFKIRDKVGDQYMCIGKEKVVETCIHNMHHSVRTRLQFQVAELEL